MNMLPNPSNTQIGIGHVLKGRETANIWEYATVEPALAGDAVSDIDLYLLSECGFSHVFNEQDGSYFFYTKEGIRNPEHCDMDHLKDIQVMDELDWEVLAVDEPEDLPPFACTFARILRRAGMPEIAIKGCFGGDKLQPGVFGGFAIRITQTHCSYQDTNGVLSMMAELGTAFPGTEDFSNQDDTTSSDFTSECSPADDTDGDSQVREYEVLLYPIMSIVMRDVRANNWIEAIKKAAEQFTHYNGVWPHDLCYDDGFDRCLVNATGDPDQRIVTRWIYRDELETVLKS